jgi:serine/threonine protein kinase
MSSLEPISPSSAERIPVIESCPYCGEVMDMSGIRIFSRVACAECGREFVARSRIDRYQVLGQLAEGGTAKVFRALDPESGTEVALKIISLEAMGQHESQARMITSIQHPHIVRVLDFGMSQGVFFLAMEFLGGGSLDDLILDRGRVDEATSMEVAIQLAEGLAAALERGLLHRDIKPANILFASSGCVKLVDFGLSAQPLDELWGTPDYIAPEKLAEQPEDHRSDIYSLGSTLFHALAGRPPYETCGLSLAALRELKKNPVDLRNMATGLREETISLVDRMMAFNPDGRPRGYPELIAELREVLAKVRPAAH